MSLIAADADIAHAGSARIFHTGFDLPHGAGTEVCGILRRTRTRRNGASARLADIQFTRHRKGAEWTDLVHFADAGSFPLPPGFSRLYDQGCRLAD
jgi:hypothetical protein